MTAWIIEKSENKNPDFLFGEYIDKVFCKVLQPCFFSKTSAERYVKSLGGSYDERFNVFLSKEGSVVYHLKEVTMYV